MNESRGEGGQNGLTVRDAESLGAEEKLSTDEAAQASKISLQVDALKVEQRSVKNRCRMEISGAARRKSSGTKS